LILFPILGVKSPQNPNFGGVNRLYLIVSLVLSRLDYGNAVLAGLPAYQFRRLQSVMNAAARLIYGLRHSDHISDALISLHWLRAQERVRFKKAVLKELRRHT